MPAPLVRKTIWLLVAALVAAAVLVLSLPYLASTQINRTRIARELGQQSGFRVTLGAAPEIRLWPNFHAILRDVAFHAGDDMTKPPALRAETITADISAWAALRGEVEFSDVQLQRPVLRLERRDGLLLPHVPRFGRLRSALDSAGSNSGASVEGVGLVRFTDGRVVVEPDGAEVLSGATGSFDWRTIPGPASLNASATWRGQDAAVSVFVEKPLALIEGGSSAANASMRAAPLSGEFRGTVSNAEGLSFQGAVSLSSPSLREALEWTGTPIAPGAAIGAIAVSGQATGNRERVRIDDAQLTIGGKTGTGALELIVAGDRPAISGTLAFETIELDAVLAAFDPPPAADATDAPAFDMQMTDQFALDLRLSAARATGGPFALDDVAATAQIRPGLAAFDISDARALGGQVQSSLRIDRKPTGDVVEIRYNATDIDWAALAEATAWTRHAPRARGSLSATLRGPVVSRSELPRTLTGTISGRLGPGRIEGLDVGKAMQQATQGGFFPLSTIADGALPFDGLEFKAQMLGGAASIESARAWNKDYDLSITGVVPYVGRSLALSGTLKPLAKAEEAPRHFFVGGSWNAPYVAPMLPAFSPE